MYHALAITISATAWSLTFCMPQRLPVTEGLDVEQVCKARCQNCCIAMPSTATVFLWAVGPLAQLCNISIMLALLSTIWYYFSRCAWKDAVSWCNVLLELGNIQRTQQAKTACPMTLTQCVSGRSTGWLHPEFRVLLGFLSTKMQTWKTTFNIYTVEDYKQSAILLDAWQLLVLAHPFEAMWCSSESGGSEAQRPVPRASSGFQVPLKQCTVMHFVTSWAIDYKWINYFEFQNSECLCFIEISDKRAACRACVQW